MKAESRQIPQKLATRLKFAYCNYTRMCFIRHQDSNLFMQSSDDDDDEIIVLLLKMWFLLNILPMLIPAYKYTKAVFSVCA